MVMDIVDGMYDKFMADARIAETFSKTNMEKQRVLSKQFFVWLLGGPTDYQGKSMFEAHRGRGITDKDFDTSFGYLA